MSSSASSTSEGGSEAESELGFLDLNTKGETSTSSTLHEEEGYKIRVLGSDEAGLMQVKAKLGFEQANLPPLQSLMAKWSLSSGKDLIVECHDYKDEAATYRLMAVHLLNLILQARDRILANTQALKLDEKGGDEDRFRDQGFTRPRCLVLLPMRNSALSLVEALMEVWRPLGGQIDNQQRLQREFGWRGEDSDDEQPPPDSKKPADFNHRFRDNTDDCFRLGIKMTRKSLKLFSDFYSSDLIIASPLGLRMVIDGQASIAPAPKRQKHDKPMAKGLDYRRKQRVRAKKGDSDFLSSIQCLLVGEVECLAMQNWEHLTHCLEHLNRMPTDPHGCDFGRVLPAYLDGLGATLRQSIWLSRQPLADLNHCLGVFCSNWRGRVTINQDHGPQIIKQLSKQVKPTFHRFQAASLTSQADDRLAAFMAQIIPLHLHSDHVAILVSSYFDFCLLRQHLLDRDYSLCWLSEYDDEGQVTGARAKFFNGHAKLMLITERFHFYHRFHIRGIKHLIFYQPWEHKHFTLEYTATGLESCAFLYCQYDWLRMERLVGTQKIEALFS